MTTCPEPGCGGTIAADGYCDTCGTLYQPGAHQPGGASSAAGTWAASAPVAPGAPAAPPVGSPAGPPAGHAALAGQVCPQPGCGGTIEADGYCDTCGLSATSRPATTPSAGPGSGPGTHQSSVSIGGPTPPSTSSRLGTTPGGTARNQSRRTVVSARVTSARTRLGRGLVTVAPTPAGDPSGAIMTDDEIQAVLGTVPEGERYCTACGRPVGRAVDGRPGRVKGFCGSCRTPFDFITNAPSLARGELVAGQYQILGPLAHGGLGWIYLGQDRAVSDRWVVLKGLLNQTDTDAVLAAVAERQYLAAIDHSNIVKIYNFVSHKGAGYIVMEMVGGESLSAKLKRRREAGGGPLPPQEAIAYILGILPAFSYLHEHGMVYNDLKPANIMAVDDDVKLIDVGAVMRIDDQQAAIFGTQGFQAPEVAELGPSVSSDLYTIGRTLAVLILRFVFHEGQYLHALPSREDEPLFAQWESLHRLLLRACAYHRDDRFQSAGEMNEQLLGVLREMAALSDGRPRAWTSTQFEGDQMTSLLTTSPDGFDVSRPDWRVLPPALVDTEDPAAAFLAGLPTGNPAQTLELLASAIDGGQVGATVEVELTRARAQVELGLDPEAALARVEAADPWDWRARWYRAIHHLQTGRAAEAAEGFSGVWTELPGESAPKLAVALAAEVFGELGRAAEVYELVTASDAAYVSAAFGLARCRSKAGTTQGVIEAFNRVPPSSAAHFDAQIAMARTLVAGGPTGRPSIDELAAASATIDRLQLDALQRAQLAADVYRRALAGLEDGSIQGGPAELLGRPLTARSLREGLEAVYRTQARLAATPAERIALVDEANRVRPRSLV